MKVAGSYIRLAMARAAFAAPASPRTAALAMALCPVLRSLVTVAGALAAAQLAYAAVITGSVHFTSTATMALQNAQQVQSIMLMHHKAANYH